MDEQEAAVAKVKASFAAITAATAQYEEDLRAAYAVGVKRGRFVKELGRSPEALRQDAMPEVERAAVRLADAERKRKVREAAKS